EERLLAALLSAEHDARRRLARQNAVERAAVAGRGDVLDEARVHIAVGVEDLGEEGFAGFARQRLQGGADRVARAFQPVTGRAVLEEDRLAAGAVAGQGERLAVRGQDLPAVGVAGAGEDFRRPRTDLGVLVGEQPLAAPGVDVPGRHAALLQRL